jgi:hypothetical protein
VRFRLTHPLSALLDPGYVEAAVRRHFEPLLDPRFAEILAAHYAAGLRIELNGRPLAAADPGAGWVPLALRFGRRRKPSAQGYLERRGDPLPDDLRGVALSTFGKVIKRGWDWLGLAPAPGVAERVTGLIEAPGLAECLTLNKADFVRAGPRGATWLSYRKAVLEVVATQLAQWGDAGEVVPEARRRQTRPVERDLESVLVDLARSFPLLASLVDHRPGGQRRLPLGGAAATLGGLHPAREQPADAKESEPEVAAETHAPAASPVDEAAAPASAATEPPALMPQAALPGGRGPRRPARYGLTIRFEQAADDAIARLSESTVWVNESHPAYRRAVASRSEGYHLALAVGMALAPLAVEPAHAHAFVTKFLARWGEAAERSKPRGRRR